MATLSGGGPDPATSAAAPTREAVHAALQAIGRLPDDAIDIGEAALLLAALARPAVPLDRYRAHLAELAQDYGEALGDSAGDVDAAAAALVEVLHRRHGYAGDSLTYDDPQNANLMRVIDRRKGLPVALGILYMHTARSRGVVADGLAFPGHFLIGLTVGGRRLLLDPFNGGRTVDAATMRQLLKSLGGDATELSPAHHRAVPTRSVLLRLQNNVKIRALKAGETARATEALRAMTALSPNEAGLWFELGEVETRAGNLAAAVAAFEAAREAETDGRLKLRLAEVIASLKRRLN